MITCHGNRFLIWLIQYLDWDYSNPKFIWEVKVGCIKDRDIYFLKALLTGAITPKWCVWLAWERDGLLKKKKRKKGLSVLTHREGPHSTSHLTEWHTCCVCHRKYLSGWQEETETAIEKNLLSVLWSIPRRRGKETGELGDEGGKIYLRKKGLAEARPPWKNTISCTARAARTPRTQTL